MGCLALWLRVKQRHREVPRPSLNAAQALPPPFSPSDCMKLNLRVVRVECVALKHFVTLLHLNAKAGDN
ncbi:hypothetical protein NQZ68_037726 [Dissostichus eleginoides]|nr:hypothetical protein NQZ68_037726 [Dissostichus eleginoides]